MWCCVSLRVTCSLILHPCLICACLRLASLLVRSHPRSAAAEEEKRVALQRQLIELTGSTESQLALEEERAKEERVELMRRQIVRRVMNRDLSLGWQCWLDLWEAKTYAMSRLREVGNRFRAPELAEAFSQWAVTWERERAAQRLAAATAHKARLEAQSSELSGELAAVKAEYEEKLRKSEASRVILLEKVALLGGGAAEVAELLEAQSALDKEKRVELLRRQIARRMLNQGIIRGWTAWNQMWRARKEALTVMRLIGKKFKAPELANAFEFWADECREARKKAMDKKRLAELRGESAAAVGEAMTMAEQVEHLMMELKTQKLSAEEDKQRALQRQLVELTGTAEQLAALNEEKSKEERVELLRRQATRRMLNRDISWGWQCWLELWEAKTYAMGRLRDVGNRFKAPELANAFGFWSGMCAEIRRSAQMAEIEKQSKSLEHMLRQARFEVGQMNLVKVANADQIAALQEKNRELADSLHDRDERLSRLLGYEREADALRTMRAAALDAQKLAEERREEAESENVKQREADKDLLERLLAEQRKQFEEDQESAKKQLRAQSDERQAYESTITQLNKDIANLQMSLAEAQRTMKAEADQLKAEVCVPHDPLSPFHLPLAVGIPSLALALPLLLLTATPAPSRVSTLRSSSSRSRRPSRRRRSPRPSHRPSATLTSTKGPMPRPSPSSSPTRCGRTRRGCSTSSEAGMRMEMGRCVAIQPFRSVVPLELHTTCSPRLPSLAALRPCPCVLRVHSKYPLPPCPALCVCSSGDTQGIPQGDAQPGA